MKQLLCAAKVAQLEYGRFRVKQQILRLDITMANAQRMDIGQASEQLIHIELHVERD